MPKIKETDVMENELEKIPSPVQSNKRKKRSLSSTLNIILFIALLSLGYAYYSTKKQLVLVTNPEAQAQVARKEAEEIITALKAKVVLPEGEFPEVLTINDSALAVKEQPALQGVVDGDKILLYSQAGRAYVFSPSRNIIVNILPFTPPNQTSKPSNGQQSVQNVNSPKQPETNTSTTSANKSKQSSADEN